MSIGGAAPSAVAERVPRIRPPALGATLLLLSTLAQAAEPDDGTVDFNPAFLQGGSKVDVSRFSKGNPVLPGDYLVDLQVNGRWVNRTTVSFIGQPGSDIAQPCIDRSIFDRVGVDMEKLSEPARAELQAAGHETCLAIARLIQD